MSRAVVVSLLVVVCETALCDGRDFTFRQQVPHLVSLEESTRTYHFRTCARFDRSRGDVVAAAATLRGYVSDPACAATAAVREWRTVRVRQAPKLTTRTNVLFVGNSLTYFNDLPWLVQQLSAAADATRPIRAEFVGSGGATLDQQWERGHALERIYSDSWDYVVLQEQSGRPVLSPEKTAQSVARFDAAIRESGARSVLFMPWTTLSLRSAHDRVASQFGSLATSHDILLAPVGSAWRVAERSDRRIALYDSGGNHPTLAGSYFSACVIYSTLRGRSAAGLPHAFAHARASNAADRLTADDAAFLQELAWRVVSASVPVGGTVSRHHRHR